MQVLYSALKGLDALNSIIAASQMRLAEYSSPAFHGEIEGLLAHMESCVPHNTSAGAPEVSIAGSLAAIQEQCKKALLKVSDLLFSKFGQMLNFDREALHSSLGLISTGEQGQIRASLALHSKDIEAKMFELRASAFNVNVSWLFQFLTIDDLYSTISNVLTFRSF